MAPLRPVLVSAFAALLLLLPAAGAQVGVFGTQVKLGDSDYVPLLKTTASLPLTIYRADLGRSDNAYDDCLIIGTDPSEPAPVKHLRLTTCFGKPAGTQIGTSDTEVVRFSEFVLQPVARIATRYVDLSENAKFDGNEPSYIVFYPGVDPVPTTGLPGTKQAGATGVEGAWTLRLLPAFGLPAGTLVKTGDEDLADHAGSARTQAFSLAEREDKGWYLIPSASGKAVKDLPVPVKAIRIGLQGTVAPQPLIQPSGLELPSESPVAGEAYKFTVRYSNDGATAGPGLLVTRVNGAIVDARLTPWLNPGQPSAQLIAIEAPEHGGPMRLDVNGYKVTLYVSGEPATEHAATTAATAALEARIAALEAALATAAPAAPATVKSASVQDAPGLMPFTLLALLAIGALAVRRRLA